MQWSYSKRDISCILHFAYKKSTIAKWENVFKPGKLPSQQSFIWSNCSLCGNRGIVIRFTRFLKIIILVLTKMVILSGWPCTFYFEGATRLQFRHSAAPVTRVKSKAHFARRRMIFQPAMVIRFAKFSGCTNGVVDRCYVIYEIRIHAVVFCVPCSFRLCVYHDRWMHHLRGRWKLSNRKPLEL